LNPSSVLSTSMSAQSDGRTAQSGFGSWTRRPVLCDQSKVVQRLLGNGPASGLDRSKRGWTPAACASEGSTKNVRSAKSSARRSDIIKSLPSVDNPQARRYTVASREAKCARERSNQSDQLPS
jgi:hypothetical protein